MAKCKSKSEQLDLIDTKPKNAKEIEKAARLYMETQGTRIALLAEEVEQKHKVLELVRAAKLQPLEGGVIKFRCDSLTISITPRDELIKVKEDSSER
jgi:hypothetical protein